MIFPKYIKKNDIIAVTAPSNGITDEIKIKRFNKGVEQLKNRGYNVEFTDSVFKADKRGVSNTAKIRAEEFTDYLIKMKSQEYFVPQVGII